MSPNVAVQLGGRRLLAVTILMLVTAVFIVRPVWSIMEELNPGEFYRCVS